MYAALNEGKTALYQWDTGQYLQVSQDVYRVDFTFRTDPKIVYGVFAQSGKVVIPDGLLQSYGILDVLIMDRKATYERMELPVIERPLPPGYVVTERGTVITYEELENILKKLHFASTDGFTMAGDIDMAGYKIDGLVEPVGDNEAVRKRYVDKNFMKSTGGTVTGRYYGFFTPEKEDEPATKGYADAAKADAIRQAAQAAGTQMDNRHVFFRVTMPVSWSGSGPYTQSIPVSGLKASDAPHVTAVYDANGATAIAQRDAWSCVAQAEATEGALVLTCLEEKPTAAVPLLIEVIR